ncbi:hypothetical protein [Methanospirillum lacunae]
MVCSHIVHQAVFMIPGVLLMLLFLALPVSVAGSDSLESSYHTIDIEYPDIITPEIYWQKCLNGPITDSSYIIQQTSDGGYLLIGRPDSSGENGTDSRQNPGYWIVKQSPGGEIVWQKSYRGSGWQSPDILSQTESCGYAYGGKFGPGEKNATINQSMNTSWIIKLTREGLISWEKSLDTPNHEEIHSIQQTRDSGYIVSGSIRFPDGLHTPSRSDRDIWIAKLTSSGDLIWKKTFGGTKDDLGYSIRQTIDGGYIMAGASASHDGDVSGNHGDLDYWIVKLTPGVEITWQKCFGGSQNDIPYFIQQLSDGGYIIAGASASDDGDVSGNHGELDYWIVKLSPGGDLAWQRCLGGKGIDEAKSIRQTRDGGYIVAGGSASDDGDVTGNHGDSDYWIVKLGPDGGLKWEKSLGGSMYDSGESILQTNDGGYIIAGITLSEDIDIAGNREK